MSQHECCGHGDILVGGTWEDEIVPVIRDTPLYLDEEQKRDEIFLRPPRKHVHRYYIRNNACNVTVILECESTFSFFSWYSY